MVDDEGVDLVFHRRDSAATLAGQVKTRMSDSKRVQGGNLVVFFGSQTFRARADLDMRFVAVDIQRGAVMKAWLVPSVECASVLQPQNSGEYRFGASLKEGSKDRWASRRLEASDLGCRLPGAWDR